MTKGVRLDDEAENELLGAVGRYERVRPGLGAEFWDEAYAALLKVEESPQIGTPILEADPRLNLRKSFVRRFPFLIVYCELSDHTRVVAIAHVRKRPLYWIGRVEAADER